MTHHMLRTSVLREPAHVSSSSSGFRDLASFLASFHTSASLGGSMPPSHPAADAALQHRYISVASNDHIEQEPTPPTALGAEAEASQMPHIPRPLDQPAADARLLEEGGLPGYHAPSVPSIPTMHSRTLCTAQIGIARPSPAFLRLGEPLRAELHQQGSLMQLLQDTHLADSPQGHIPVQQPARDHSLDLQALTSTLHSRAAAPEPALQHEPPRHPAKEEAVHIAQLQSLSTISSAAAGALASLLSQPPGSSAAATDSSGPQNDVAAQQAHAQPLMAAPLPPESIANSLQASLQAAPEPLGSREPPAAVMQEQAAPAMLQAFLQDSSDAGAAHLASELAASEHNDMHGPAQLETAANWLAPAAASDTPSGSLSAQQRQLPARKRRRKGGADAGEPVLHERQSWANLLAPAQIAAHMAPHPMAGQGLPLRNGFHVR